MAKYDTSTVGDENKSIDEYNQTNVDDSDEELVIATTKLTPARKYTLTKGANGLLIHIRVVELNNANSKNGQSIRRPTENLPDIIKRIIETNQDASNWANCINIEKVANPHQYES